MATALRPFSGNTTEIYFTGEYMEAYIPESYFNLSDSKKGPGIAEVIGDHFATLGIFNIRTFNDVDGKQPNKLQTVNLPVQIVTYPSGGFERKTLDLIGKGAEKYFVLKYYNGDTFCSKQVPQSVQAFKSFLNLLMVGKLPKTFSYDDIITIWEQNFVMNGVKFDIPDVIKELIVSEIYRDPSAPEHKFGYLIGKNPTMSRYDYITATTKDITKYNSSFAAVTFENMDEALVSAANTTRTERKEQTSPMEKILKY